MMSKADFITAFVLTRSRAIAAERFNYAQAIRDAVTAWAMIQQELAK